MSMVALRWVRPLSVTSTQKVVLWAMADQADDEGQCWPSMAGLMEATCLSERALRDALRTLEAAGLVATEVGGGRNRTSRYRLAIARNPASGSNTRHQAPPLGDNTRRHVPPLATETRHDAPLIGTERGHLAPKGGATCPRTLRVERKKEKKEPPDASRLAPKGADGRGERLAADWLPGDDEREFAASLGLRADRVAPGFRDYWISKPGAMGRKSDWPATWRNWCRREAERAPKAKPEFRNGFFTVIARDREAAEAARLANEDPNPFLTLEAPRAH
jgi:hypothetical protein